MGALSTAPSYTSDGGRARVSILVVCINIYYTSIAKKSDYTLLIYTGKTSSLPPFWLPINQINSPTTPKEQTKKK